MRLKPPPYIPRAILNISFPTRRWWRSWAVAGSPAVYVLIYGIYQYHNLHSKHQPDAISSFVVYSCVSALAQPSQPQHHRCNTTAATPPLRFSWFTPGHAGTSPFHRAPFS